MNDNPEMPQHSPPKFIVCSPGSDVTYKFYDAKPAMDKAEALARLHPGTLIDIYQHATAIRKRED
jgi:hypothetical protein